MTINKCRSSSTATRELLLAEHGLDVARAGEIFEGETLTLPDDRVDYGEIRYIAVGFMDGRMVVTFWTQRTQTRRMISLMKANDREQKFYA